MDCGTRASALWHCGVAPRVKLALRRQAPQAGRKLAYAIISRAARWSRPIWQDIPAMPLFAPREHRNAITRRREYRNPSNGGCLRKLAYVSPISVSGVISSVIFPVFLYHHHPTELDPLSFSVVSDDAHSQTHPASVPSIAWFQFARKGCFGGNVVYAASTTAPFLFLSDNLSHCSGHRNHICHLIHIYQCLYGLRGLCTCPHQMSALAALECMIFIETCFGCSIDTSMYDTPLGGQR